MGGRIDDVARVVADLAQAAGAALDPSTILSRTLGALGQAVDVGGASLWLDGPEGPALRATHPDGSAASLGDSGSAATLTLQGSDGVVGHLVVHPPSGSTFGDDEHALLEIAAGQISGSLERARLFQEVMELERLKSDFIARVSHELRTPITIIHGFLDTLLAHDATLGADQRRHMLERSQVAASRLSTLIEELLILSRLDAGVLTPDLSQVELQQMLVEVQASSVEPEQVIIAAPPDARLNTDAALLTRALGLVVDNAIKYGGTAEVSVTVPDRAGGRWLIEVRDRGAGFADDVRDTAFEMFTRSQRTTAVPGLGVGLPIARTLIEVLDGDIAIDDPAGAGALVRISLPAR